MIETLPNNQLVALAMVHHLYYHHDPISLISVNNKGQDFSMSFWLNIDGSISCSNISSSIVTRKVPSFRLPDIQLPLKSVIKDVDLSMPSGRTILARSVLDYLIVSQWSELSPLNSIVFTDEHIAALKLDLSNPVLINKEKRCAQVLLEQVVIPTLIADVDTNTRPH